MLKKFIWNIFSGFSQTLFQGVYATCIGHYVKYGGRDKKKNFFFLMKKKNLVFCIDTRKRLIGLHGFLVGCGEILGKN